MQRLDIVNKLQELHHDISDDDLIMDQSLSDQGYDSLDKVEFVIKAEKAFDLSIDDSTFEKLQTPNDIADLLFDVLNVHKPKAQEKAN
jgi:acyl carrier protein